MVCSKRSSVSNKAEGSRLKAEQASPGLGDCKSAPLDVEEIRRAVALGFERGLIHRPGEAAPIAKDGLETAQLAIGIGASVRSQWMRVDPALATTWLENNFRNRPVKEDVVAAYARDMLNGVWIPTHQGVAFNDRDELIDGQHRLLAIVLSKCTVMMMVTFGLPSVIEGPGGTVLEMTTMDAVDRGRTRSVADQLKIQHGLKNGTLISAICASIGGICYRHRTRRLSVGQTLEIYRAFEQPVNWVLAHRSREPGLKQAGVLTAFAFAMAMEPEFAPPSGDSSTGGIGPSEISFMFEQLVEGGDSFEAGMPLAHLHEFLRSDQAKLLTRGTDRGLAELVLEAIRLELLGAKIEKLDVRADGADYFRERQNGRVARIAAMFALPSSTGSSASPGKGEA